MIEKRTIEGRWWVQGKPEPTLYGILEFDPDEGLNLNTKDARENVLEKVAEDSVNKIAQPFTILGRDQHDTPISLFFCNRAGGGSSAALNTKRYHAGYRTRLECFRLDDKVSDLRVILLVRLG